MGNHAGFLLHASKAFPWGPPREIGEILSADSNIPRSGGPSLFGRCLLALATWIAIYMVGEIGIHLPQFKADPAVFRGIVAAFGLMAAGLLLAYLWPLPPYCSYIGELGIAYFEGGWGQSQPSKCQVILYRHVTALLVYSSHSYKNLMYQNTNFAFSWHSDVNQPPLLRIAGQHTAHDQLPEADNLYHFALRAEEIWTAEWIKRNGVDAPLDRPVVFPCRKNELSDVLMGAGRNKMKEIRLGAREIQFVYDDHVDSLPLAELKSASTKRGVLLFQNNDANWFSLKGKFRIDYQYLGNAQAFMLYLSRAMDGV